MVLRTDLAINRAVLAFFGLLLGCFAAATIHASQEQRPQIPSVLDLTAEVPRDEEGYYHGIPGMSGGGGAWRPGPTETQRYQLPLTAKILRATRNIDGNFVLEVLLRNTDNTAFDLPSSVNLTAVEKPSNRSRRLFFFKLQPVDGSAHEREALGFAATGGSTSIPGSFIRLDPGKSLRVLLLASSESIRRSFTQESEKLGVQVSCHEWKLDDNRFFLSGISEELPSVNTIQFGVSGDQIAPVQP